MTSCSSPVFCTEPPTFEQHPTNTSSGSGSLAGVPQKAKGLWHPCVPADKHRHVLHFGHIQSSQGNCDAEQATALAWKAEQRCQGPALQIKTVYLFKINLQSDAEIGFCLSSKSHASLPICTGNESRAFSPSCTHTSTFRRHLPRAAPHLEIKQRLRPINAYAFGNFALGN